MSRAVVVLDGGLSTQLERHGADFSGRLWTGKALLEKPDVVERAHRDFVEAGAMIISTASYQISRSGFIAEGMTAVDADLALTRSVEIARAATQGTDVKVAASVGPYGATLHDGSEYRGNYGVDQGTLEDFHRERIAVLAAAKPDYFAVETIPELTEARALVAVLADYPEIPVWVSFSCGDEAQLASGETIEEAARTVAVLPQLVAVGMNCVPPENVAPLARRIASVTDTPVIGYPNRGGQWDSVTNSWSGQTPRTLAQWWPQWHAAGVSFVGGCCGHDAAAIAQLRDVLRR